MMAVVATLRRDLSRLEGLWHGVEYDLARMGVVTLADLRGRSPRSLVEAYCTAMSRPFDAMLQPLFASIIWYAESGVAVPWWRIMRDEAVLDRNAAMSS